MTKLGLTVIYCIFFVTMGMASGVTVRLTDSRIQDVTIKASSDSPAGNPAATTLEIREYWRSDTIYDYRGFIKIDLSSIHAGSKITAATLGLWYIDAYGGANVNQLQIGYTIDEFNPAVMTYRTYDGVNFWTDGDGAGVDGYSGVNPHALGSITVDPATPNRYVTLSTPEMVAYLQAQFDSKRSAYLELAINDDNGLWQRFYSVDCEDSSKRPYLEIQFTPPTISGDATLDGVVDVRDLAVLAANYGRIQMSWQQGDFNGDGIVDVSDLGILAANYGYNSTSADFNADYASVFGQKSMADDQAETDDTIDSSETDETTEATSICSSIGLTLIVGLGLAVLGLAGVGKFGSR